MIESMTGARFVHDTLEELGWDVLIADAAKVKGLGAAGRSLGCTSAADVVAAAAYAVLLYAALCDAGADD